MKMQDYECTECGERIELLYRRGHHDARLNQCRCGADHPFQEIVAAPPNIKSDGVPGGFVIENLDRHPRRFESKSEYQAELKARGLTTERGNQWRGDPGNGSDKPRNGMSRWI